MSNFSKAVIFILVIIILVWSGFLLAHFLEGEGKPALINKTINQKVNQNKNINKDLNVNKNVNVEMDLSAPLETSGEEDVDIKEEEIEDNVTKEEESKDDKDEDKDEDLPTAKAAEVELEEGHLMIYYLDEDAYNVGQKPYEVSIEREKEDLEEADEVFILKQLFWGPVAEDSLTTILSGFTGFRRVSTAEGVSHVYLVGDCNTGGATYTIADLIYKNLKQLAHVDYVKIYDDDENTEEPEGQSDSIPECLEP